MIFFGRVFTGFVVSMPVLCVFAGGIEDGFGLLFVSIVCTFGAGLLGWVPLWWVVGRSLEWLLFQFANRDHSSGEGNPSDWSVAKIAGYITSARAEDMNEEEILRNLRAAGWSDEAIDEARTSLE